MNTDQLIALGKNAAAWARTYTLLKEALLREGVVEDEAREEARNAANFAALYADLEDEGAFCPVCRRGE